jgi:Family of unknown function (DUF6065)
MTEPAASAVCRFYRLIPGAPEPRRADRSADGTLPMAAYRYCEAIASASAFGWYLYPPLNFSLIWDGTEIAWTYEGAEGWYPLRAAQYPGFIETFAGIAPEGLRDLAPTFLAQGKLPGTAQIWSGYLGKTAPGWALLSRGTANIPRTELYENFEGIIESDTWLGPLFTNIRLKRTHSPVEFHTSRPMFQVQPLWRPSYTEPNFAVLDSTNLTIDDWQRFASTMRPNTDMMRAPGHYAVATRKKLRGCSVK